LGTLTVLSMTRDGVPVVPTTGLSRFIDGFIPAVQDKLTSTAPSAWRLFRWTSELSLRPDAHESLSCIVGGKGGNGYNSWFRVDAAGAYELRVRYGLPPLRTPASELCSLESQAMTVTFTITGS
jgi:hypothetical protein